MERNSLDISALTVETFAPSADAAFAENTNGTISGCPTSCVCCD